MEELAALDASGLGAEAGPRRRALAESGDDEIGERLAQAAMRLRETRAAHEAIAGAARLPLGEVLASPFALRAVAMGVEVGACARHRELRLEPDWPAALRGSEAVQDPEHGLWDRGVLRTGKYQGFMAEAPFATYDPAHVSKWGPHEMMHRAGGFFWRRGASRFELYVAARLNELVPVVLWYGPEQAMRLDEGAFDRAAAGRRPEADLARARWLDLDEAQLRAAAVRAAPLLRSGLLHFERELAAIDEELRTGRRVPVGHPFLDASSDATAYVVGHHARLSTPDVTAVLEAVGPSVRDDDVLAYRERVERLFDRLLFAPLTLDLAAAARERRRREAWDLSLRAAHLSGEAKPELAALVDELAALFDRGADTDVRSFRSRIEQLIDPSRASVVLADGSEAGRAHEQLLDGLEQVLPCTWALMSSEPDALDRFAGSDGPWRRGSLSGRALRWLDESGAPPAAIDMARLEHAIVTAKRDDAIEHLCERAPEAIEELRGGVLVPSEGFERLALDHDCLSAHAAFAAGEGPDAPAPERSVVWIGAYLDGVSALPTPPAVDAAIEQMRGGAAPAAEVLDAIDASLGPLPEGWPADGEAWVRELLEAGVLGWRPGCSRGSEP